MRLSRFLRSCQRIRSSSKKLKVEASGPYSGRLNITDRVVFEIGTSSDPKYEGVVTVIRLRTNYKGMVLLFLL